MRSTPPHSSSVKGAALREFFGWYIKNWERVRIDTVLNALPPAERAGLIPGAESFGVVSSTWYPSSIVHVLLNVICDSMSPVVRSKLVKDSTAHVVDQMMHGVYAVLFRMVASPERYASHIQRAWRQLHDTGDRRVILVSPDELESITSDWGGHHLLLCEVASETMAHVFTKMGYHKVIAVRTSCIANGDPDCRTTLRWSE